jgi:hypothetical protein
MTPIISTKEAMSPQELTASLDRIRSHVSVADGWAQQHLRLFPNLSSVSIDFGVALLLEFGMTLTWERK